MLQWSVAIQALNIRTFTLQGQHKQCTLTAVLYLSKDNLISGHISLRTTQLINQDSTVHAQELAVRRGCCASIASGSSQWYQQRSRPGRTDCEQSDATSSSAALLQTLDAPTVSFALRCHCPDLAAPFDALQLSWLVAPRAGRAALLQLQVLC